MTWAWNKGGAAIDVDVVDLQAHSIGGDKPGMASALPTYCHGRSFCKVVKKGGALQAVACPGAVTAQNKACFTARKDQLKHTP